MFAPVGHTELHHASDLLTKAHTAGAVDAAAHLLHGNQRPYILDGHYAFVFLIPRARAAVAHCEILQLAFTTLVADRAVKRVVDQQKLHHRLLRFDRLVALGAHDHALRDRGGAGRHGLGHFFYIDQAHAAVGRNAELLVVAEMGNVGAGLLGRMHDHAAFKNVDLPAVEFDFNHCSTRSKVGRDHAGLVLYVVFEFVSVVLDHGAHRHGGGIAQGADGASLDVVGHRVQ